MTANMPRMKHKLCDAAGWDYTTHDEEYDALKEDIKGARSRFKDVVEALDGVVAAVTKLGGAAETLYSGYAGFLNESSERGRRQTNEMLALLGGQLKDFTEELQRGGTVDDFREALTGAHCIELIEAYDLEYGKAEKLKAARRKARDSFDYHRNIRDQKLSALKKEGRDPGSSPSLAKKEAKATTAGEAYAKQNEAAKDALRRIADNKDRVMGSAVQTYLHACTSLFGLLHTRCFDMYTMTVRPFVPAAVVDPSLLMPAAAAPATPPPTGDRDTAPAAAEAPAAADKGCRTRLGRCAEVGDAGSRGGASALAGGETAAGSSCTSASTSPPLNLLAPDGAAPAARAECAADADAAANAALQTASSVATSVAEDPLPASRPQARGVASLAAAAALAPTAAAAFGGAGTSTSTHSSLSVLANGETPVVVIPPQPRVGVRHRAGAVLVHPALLPKLGVLRQPAAACAAAAADDLGFERELTEPAPAAPAAFTQPQCIRLDPTSMLVNAAAGILSVHPAADPVAAQGAAAEENTAPAERAASSSGSGGRGTTRTDSWRVFDPPSASPSPHLSRRSSVAGGDDDDDSDDELRQPPRTGERPEGDEAVMRS